MPERAIVYVFFLSFLISACSVRSAGVRMSNLPPMASDSAGIELSQRIDEFVNTLAPQSFNGAIVVEKEGELIIGSGYGYAQYSEQAPFSTSTLSNTARFAQQLTAAAILKLEGSGALNLQDPLSIFFPDFPLEKEEIRVEQLLFHTSGLPQEISKANIIRSKKGFLEGIKNETLMFKPGTSYLYSEAGYRLLAAVVEAASSQKYETFIREELLEPANMENTGYVRPEFLKLVPSTEKRGERTVKDLVREYREANGDLWHLIGSSGMLSTLDDIYRWERMYLRGKLLPRQYRDRFMAMYSDFPEGVSVMGWVMDENALGTSLLRHSSNEGGFVCELLYFPEVDLTIAIVANQLNGQVEQLGMQLARIALMPNYYPAPLPYREEQFVRVPQADEARYARSLLSFVQGDDLIPPHIIVDSIYNDAFKANETDQKHLQALTNLRQRLGKAKLEKVQQAWPQYMFTFFEPEASAWYLLRLNVEQQAPYRITGIGLETVDALNATW